MPFKFTPSRGYEDLSMMELFVKIVLAVNYIWKKLHHKEVFQTFLKHVKQLEEILSCFIWAVDQGVK